MAESRQTPDSVLAEFKSKANKIPDQQTKQKISGLTRGFKMDLMLDASGVQTEEMKLGLEPENIKKFLREIKKYLKDYDLETKHIDALCELAGIKRDVFDIKMKTIFNAYFSLLLDKAAEGENAEVREVAIEAILELSKIKNLSRWKDRDAIQSERAILSSPEAVAIKSQQAQEEKKTEEARKAEAAASAPKKVQSGFFNWVKDQWADRSLPKAPIDDVLAKANRMGLDPSKMTEEEKKGSAVPERKRFTFGFSKEKGKSEALVVAPLPPGERALQKVCEIMAKIISHEKAAKKDKTLSGILKRLNSKSTDESPLQKLLGCKKDLTAAREQLRIKLLVYNADERQEELAAIISPTPVYRSPESQPAQSSDEKLSAAPGVDAFTSFVKSKDFEALTGVNEEVEAREKLVFEVREVKEDMQALLAVEFEDGDAIQDHNILILDYLLVRMLNSLEDEASVEKFIENVISCLSELEGAQFYSKIQPDLEALEELQKELSPAKAFTSKSFHQQKLS